MSKYTLLIGGRRSGKTHKAIAAARNVGPRVLVVAPSDRLATHLGFRYCIYATSQRHAKGSPAPQALVLDDVHLMRKCNVLDAIGATKDHDAPIFATAHPPTTKHGKAIVDALVAAGFEVVNFDSVATGPEAERFRQLCEIIKPPGAASPAAPGA
jgi:hypothetical protein